MRAGDTDHQGGDPPCWLDRVCANCGLLNEDRYAAVCTACGAELESA